MCSVNNSICHHHMYFCLHDLPESFSNYFSKYGEITDSVIMMDKLTGRPRGFGFVTFADSEVADKVLDKEHVIDGRAVRVLNLVIWLTTGSADLYASISHA